MNDLNIQDNDRLWALINPGSDMFTDMISQYGVKDIITREVSTLNDLASLSRETTFGVILILPSSQIQIQPAATIDDPDAKNVLFTPQISKNSCPTVALLNILSNSNIRIGEVLEIFFEYIKEIDPADRTDALERFEVIKKIHNSYKIDNTEEQESQTFKSSSSKTRKHMDNEYEQLQAYHCISYTSKNDFIWELDSLNQHPIKHVPTISESWLESLKLILTEKIKHVEMLSLFAIIKNPISIKEERLDVLTKRIQVLTRDIKNEELAPFEPNSTTPVKPATLTARGREIAREIKQLEIQIDQLKTEIDQDRKDIMLNRFSNNKNLQKAEQQKRQKRCSSSVFMKKRFGERSIVSPKDKKDKDNSFTASMAITGRQGRGKKARITKSLGSSKINKEEKAKKTLSSEKKEKEKNKEKDDDNFTLNEKEKNSKKHARDQEDDWTDELRRQNAKKRYNLRR